MAGEEGIRFVGGAVLGEGMKQFGGKISMEKTDRWAPLKGQCPVPKRAVCTGLKLLGIQKILQ
jgi:hypothetical protein